MIKHVVAVKHLRISRSLEFGLHIHKLSLDAGTLLCIVGPNGSGKTTLVECLTGLLTPPVGSIVIEGMAVDKNQRPLRRILGFVPDDEDWFIKELCAREYFALLEGVYRQAGTTTDMKARIRWLTSLLQFTSMDQPLHQLSHGNKKKVQIIAGLMHQPKVIILDELRNGLDPLAIIAAEKILKQEVQRGACIIAATHDLWWAQRISDQVLFLQKGSVTLHQKTSHIVKRYGSLENLFVQTMRLPE